MPKTSKIYFLANSTFCCLIHGLHKAALTSDDRKRNIRANKNEACSLQILVDFV